MVVLAQTAMHNHTTFNISSSFAMWPFLELAFHLTIGELRPQFTKVIPIPRFLRGGYE